MDALFTLTKQTWDELTLTNTRNLFFRERLLTCLALSC